jgi:hypothetical protein
MSVMFVLELDDDDDDDDEDEEEAWPCYVCMYVPICRHVVCW